MTLTWAEIDARWPGAGVMWDAKIAPTLDWEPRFRDRDGVLWADSPDDHANRQHRHRDRGCRCRVWDDGEWVTHPEWKLLEIKRAVSDLAAQRVEPRTWWVGTPYSVGRGIFSGIDRSVHPESLQNYRNRSGDMVDALTYAYRHMWDARRAPNPRWPTLRRVLGRNESPVRVR